MKADQIPSVRLRVTIVVDIDAADYLEAGEHQKKIERHLDAMKIDYPAASLSLRQRRPIVAAPLAGRDYNVAAAATRPSLRSVSAGVPSGRLNEYE